MVGEMFYDAAKVSDLADGRMMRLFDGSCNLERSYYDGMISNNFAFSINKIGLGIDVGMGEQADTALRLILGGLIVQLKVGDKQKALMHSMVFLPNNITELPELTLSEDVIKSLEDRPRWALGGYCSFLSCDKPIVVPTRYSCNVFVWLNPSVVGPIEQFTGTQLFQKIPPPVVRVFLAGEKRRDLL